MRVGFYGRYGRGVTGLTLEEGACGGSESALVYMAQELQKLGHEVYVFNKCGEAHGDYKNVKYRDIAEFGPILKSGTGFDILVVFRDLDILKVLGPDTSGIGIKRKVYWAHDDQSYLWDNPKMLETVGGWLNNNSDKVFAVSSWQADIYREKFGVAQEKIFVTRNGVNLDFFKSSAERDPKRLIYTSVPDRGLDVLLEIFPEIKERAQVDLYVFSSFKTYGMPETDNKIEDLFQKAKSIGVNLKDPLPQKDLARELQKSALMVYPNHKSTFHPVYAETACIAVLEAQAAGTPVISSKRGALPESILDGETGVLIEGDPYSKEYQARFIEETVKLMQDKARWQRMSQKARERIEKEYPWKQIAAEWQEEFNKIL